MPIPCEMTVARAALDTPFEHEYEKQVERNVQDSRNQNEQHWTDRLAHAPQNRNDTVEGHEQKRPPDINAEISHRLRNNLFRRIGQAKNRLGKNYPCNGQYHAPDQHEDEEGGERKLYLLILFSPEKL